MVSPKPVFFASAAEFGEWLETNAASAEELLVGYWKVGTGRPSMTWSESVDEALRFGWIDGVRRRIDEHAYQIRFTPRRRDSIWSAVNLAKVQALIEAGRMRPAGMAAYEARREDKSVLYSYEPKAHPAPAQPPELTPAELRQFKRAKEAWAFFESCPPSHRKRVLHWITSAKQPATRQRRLEKTIETCGRGERF